MSITAFLLICFFGLVLTIPILLLILDYKLNKKHTYTIFVVNLVLAIFFNSVAVWLSFYNFIATGGFSANALATPYTLIYFISTPFLAYRISKDKSIDLWLLLAFVVNFWAIGNSFQIKADYFTFLYSMDNWSIFGLAIVFSSLIYSNQIKLALQKH
jgi:hypothetical protein